VRTTEEQISMNPMKKTAVAAALSAGLIGGGAAGMILGTPGVSGAQETTTTVQTPTDDTTSDEGGRQGRSEHLASTLAPLVEAGTITQAQADAVIAAIQEAGPPEGGGMGGHGGPGMRGGRGGPGLEAAAGAIGITEEELRTALRDGGTLAEVAEANGVDPQAVIDALVAELQTRLDERVADGDLTQEEADEKLASGTERITERMTSTLPERGEGRPEGAPDGEGDDADDDAAETPDTTD
jgi:hypothetical protein